MDWSSDLLECNYRDRFLIVSQWENRIYSSYWIRFDWFRYKIPFSGKLFKSFNQIFMRDFVQFFLQSTFVALVVLFLVNVYISVDSFFLSFFYQCTRRTVIDACVTVRTMFLYIFWYLQFVYMHIPMLWLVDTRSINEISDIRKFAEFDNRWDPYTQVRPVDTRLSAGTIKYATVVARAELCRKTYFVF